MLRLSLLTLLCFLSAICGIAQNQSENENLKGNYLGVQGNQLLRQLLNFGDAGIPDNPYFFNYTHVSDEGKGINIGFALDADEFSQQNGFNTVNTEIDNFAFRLGYEKRKNMGRRFFYGIGIDFLAESFKNITTTEDNFGSGNIIETESKTSGWGIGPRFTLNYKITERLIIGTEANYYFKNLTEKFETTFQNFPTNNVFESTDVKRFKFAVPAVIWISVKL